MDFSRVMAVTADPSAPLPLLCIGHSHVACVARAAASTGTPLTALDFWTLPGAIEQVGGAPRLSGALRQQLQEHAGPVFSMIGGAAYGVLGMLVHPRRFDVVLPTQPELPLDPDAEILPAQALRQVLASLMSDYLALMTDLRRACAGVLFHLEPPPPYADATRMQADIPWDMYPGMCHEISPAPLRYKLWAMHSQILQEWCAANRVVFVRCPAAALDEEGFLHESCYGDGAHANESYGRLVLRQMRQLA